MGFKLIDFLAQLKRRVTPRSAVFIDQYATQLVEGTIDMEDFTEGVLIILKED